MKNKIIYILILLYVIIAYLTIFNHLGSSPIKEFDEARLAVSAYEMSQGGNPLVVTFMNQPDLWNTKPPLLIWTQALFIKFFSLNETAVRLPSAIAMLMTGLLLLLFGVKIHKPYFGFLSSLILLCSWNVLFWHGGRTANYDSPLLLFITAYIISFWLYLQDTTKHKYLIAFFIFLTLAALTKDVQAFIAVPAIVLYTLSNKKLIPTLRSKYFWIGFGILTVFFFGFLFAREMCVPGYLKALWHNDIMGRYTQEIEYSPVGYGYYFSEFAEYTFKYFFFLLPFAFLFNLFNPDKEVKNLNIYALAIAIFYFSVITFGKTKLTWYSYPVVPMLCIIISLCIDTLREYIEKNTDKTQRIFVYMFLFVLLFAKPLYENIFSSKGSFSVSYNHDVSYPHNDYIKLLYKHKNDILKNIPVLYVLNEEEHPDRLFYRCIFTSNGVDYVYKDIHDIPKGGTVMINFRDNTLIADSLYTYQELYNMNESKIIKIINKKQ